MCEVPPAGDLFLTIITTSTSGVSKVKVNKCSFFSSD